MGLERIEREHGRDLATQLQTEMHSTLDEIQRVLATEGIDAAEQRGGPSPLPVPPHNSNSCPRVSTSTLRLRR